MPSKHYSSSLWLIATSLLIISNLGAKAQADEWRLTPNTCAVTGEKPACDIDLLFEYQSDIPQSLCIWMAEQAVVLACFEEKLDFKYQIQLTLEDDTLFELRDPKNNNTIKTGLVKVAKFEPANSRKRRGLNWNLL
ncbi:DUF3019 domain-containing protein [Shewanella acanthi]|uniref:DUF3019 domain-containing protein n=1 Tax=Shewanella acanthi TaxID=2864212 RepID=UPI001C659D7E|nr:DUF3019 domain-containing protein [Shewanella acanthi]QYJ78195.1 DUF3019 domain-containing protein [Shewanella acanthi]